MILSTFSALEGEAVKQKYANQEHRALQFAAALSGRSHLCELGGEAETLLFTWKMLSSGEGRERLGGSYGYEFIPYFK